MRLEIWVSLVFVLQSRICLAYDTFRAAVYEHSFISNIVTTRLQALGNMKRNLEVYEEQLREANSQGVQLIVFPEYGLTGNIEPQTKYTASLYGEAIPDPNNSTSCFSCDSPISGSEVVQALSCAARRSNMYVVANLVETISVPKQHEELHCRYNRMMADTMDGENIGLVRQLRLCNSFCQENNLKDTEKKLVYNTNVIIDPNGCIIAKYHKTSLFGNEVVMFDKVTSPQFVYVDTPLGRLGTMTCFDLVFAEPGISLVEQYSVDTIVFPTYWTMMNTTMKLYNNIIEYSSGWARRMGVNFLSANIRSREHQSFGSSIATSTGIESVYYDEEIATGRLLIADLPKKPIKPMRKPNTDLSWNGRLTANQSFSYVTGVADFGYAVIPLDSSSDQVHVCHGAVCCHLEYKHSIMDESKVNILAAYSSHYSLQSNPGPIDFEVCLFQTCRDNSIESCFQHPITESESTFSVFRLSGNFSSSYAFPTLTAPGPNFMLVEWEFMYTDVFSMIRVRSGTNHPILNAAMIAPLTA